MAALHRKLSIVTLLDLSLTTTRIGFIAFA
jgi:hypothetical protein